MKKFIKICLIFCISLYCLLIPYNVFFGDNIVLYGFSYAVRLGEIPYRDFNIVLPLFSVFLYSLPLYLCNSVITFFITQAVLLTLLFYLLEKQLSYKVYLFFFFVLLGYPLLLITGLFPGYNYLLFFFLLYLVYLEEKNANDYLIGFIIGLSIITKHTIGVFFLLPSFLYYYKDLKKIGKRIIGVAIPCVIFLFYLLVTKTFTQFLDLCVFGLLDFGSKNHGQVSIFSIFILFLCLFYFLYIFYKERKISIVYLFLTILFVIPIFDAYHLSYFIMATALLFISHISFRKNYKYVFIILSLVMIGIWTFITFHFKDYQFFSYPRYPLRYMSQSMRKEYSYIDQFQKNSDKETILFLLGTENYFYKITNHQKITYFDLPNYGNYGYDGFSKMKKRIDQQHDVYFIIFYMDKKRKEYNQQYYVELADYIKKKGSLVEKENNYMVYYVE